MLLTISGHASDHKKLKEEATKKLGEANARRHTV